MRKFTSCSMKNGILLLASAVIFFGLYGAAAATGPVVSGAIKQGGGVSATPISIPRPIQLEKFTDFVPINKDQASSGQVLGAVPGSIDGCDLVSVEDSNMVLSLRYRTAPTVKGPVYSGAFIYDENQQSIDAGYKPNALRQLPEGTTQTILVLPPKPFQSQYIMTFLIQSGKVIVNGRFKLPFLWDGQNGRLIQEAQVKMNQEKKDTDLQNKAQFCRSYASQALAQYELAVKHKLSGIVPPVWSNDYDSHYNWCMTVPDETASQGNEIRTAYLKKHAAADAATLPDAMAKKPAALPEKPILKGPGIKKPIQIKGFDPGRGP
ncbi:MAG: hypothetical protein KKE62_17350 [Proteobacteria bacterium]|nr:hypothetical protein [Pseudomonadota bacterium]MBU1386489.1 hypothetical protein [Pseudomonadota bacterium]MBU1544600.1 hypothetical protein [Pseudomonadota bacterium]MBU2481189.1 hypothetical protein [Pseudomonadota bacterium]